MAVGVGIIAVIVTFSSVLAYFIAKHVRIWYLISKFDGPLALPIVGNSYRFHTNPRDSFVAFKANLEEYREKNNGIMRLWFGTMPALFVYGAKHMEVILSSSRHIKKGFAYRFLEPWLGTGLLTSAGEKWFHRRKLLTPTFHFSILQNFLEVFNEQSFLLLEKMEKFAGKKEPVNIFPHITYCVLDIICDTAMGKHINAQGNSDNEYVSSALRMSELISTRGRLPWLWPDVIFDNHKFGKDQEKCLKILHDVTNTMIQERLHDPPKSLQASDESHDEDEFSQKQKRIAFLDLLLQMHREDESFTLEDIREEVDTFMFEGHDTTAAAISWAILLLGQHPEIQARLHEELDQVFGTSDRPISGDDLAKLSYLGCIVKEALRMVPSVPVITRDLDCDTVLDGNLVPKETIIMLHINALHQDPKHFPNPERFDPDRFLPENVAKRHPYAYVPFSAGPRNCIGQKFALMEDKTILANIFRKFTVESLQHTVDEAKPAGALVTRPFEGNIPVKLTPRK